MKKPPGLDGLLFRRQFVLTSDPALLLADGKLHIGAGYHLSVHPNLELTHVSDDDASLTLMGFALDPEHPQDGNTEILHRLAASADLHADAIRAAGKLGGRWVLMVHHNGQTEVLHDACAQRQVFFTASDYNGPFMCASEPAVMAEKPGLAMNPEAVDFIRSRKVDDFEIYWMPGDTTLHAEITALLPKPWRFIPPGDLRILDVRSVKAMPANARFFRFAAERYAASGWMEWNFMEGDGTTIGAHYAVRVRRTIYLLKIGYDERYSKTTPGNVLLEKVVEHAIAAGDVDEISLVADCEWHSHWAMTRRELHDVMILTQIPLISSWLARFMATDTGRKLLDRLSTREGVAS